MSSHVTGQVQSTARALRMQTDLCTRRSHSEFSGSGFTPHTSTTARYRAFYEGDETQVEREREREREKKKLICTLDTKGRDKRGQTA